MNDVEKLAREWAERYHDETDIIPNCETGFIAGHTSRNAEIAELQRQIDWHKSGAIHTCHENCQRLECVQQREIADLRALIDGAVYCMTEGDQHDKAAWFSWKEKFNASL